MSSTIDGKSLSSVELILSAGLFVLNIFSPTGALLPVGSLMGAADDDDDDGRGKTGDTTFDDGDAMGDRRGGDDGDDGFVAVGRFVVTGANVVGDVVVVGAAVVGAAVIGADVGMYTLV